MLSQVPILGKCDAVSFHGHIKFRQQVIQGNKVILAGRSFHTASHAGKAPQTKTIRVRSQLRRVLGHHGAILIAKSLSCRIHGPVQPA